ncbi:MAG: cation diffusion facilitator family transporter [Dehalococcoidia bacterium]
MQPLDIAVYAEGRPAAGDASLAAVERAKALRRGLRLEYVSLGWNVVEGAIAVAAGLAAGSVALIGFGVDSFVESASASVIVWRIFAERRQSDPERVAAIERLSQKLVAASLVLLGLFVIFEASRTLLAGAHPEPSPVGLALVVVSIGVMWWLSRSIRKVGRDLHSHAIEADASQTMACWWLSLFVLVGVGLNAAFGWWWADPVAAMAIAAFVLREGWKTWRGQACCAVNLPAA